MLLALSRSSSSYPTAFNMHIIFSLSYTAKNVDILNDNKIFGSPENIRYQVSILELNR